VTPSAGAPIRVAVTGGTGFVGRHVIDELLRSGAVVRALARSPSALTARPGLEVVGGDLGDPAALGSLTEGVDVVVHCAGVIAAVDLARYRASNVDGTARLVEAMPRHARLVHVSSLAAREPGVSAYARSKRESEAVVTEAGGAHVIVRPPAVYGPGDRATLPIFSQLAKGLLLMPTAEAARFSLIYVEDLARLLALLALGEPADGPTIEPDDGHPGGYSWSGLAATAGEALGRAVTFRRVPSAIAYPLALGGEIVERRLGWRPVLTREKLRELSHGDWVCRPPHGARSWRPEVGFGDGLTATVAWYRGEGWL
jgi:uncharacterized protein YbjT (DUF2867 family)